MTDAARSGFLGTIHSVRGSQGQRLRGPNLEVFRPLLGDRSIDARDRADLLALGWPAHAGWIDWQELAASDDPLAAELFGAERERTYLRARPDDERERIVETLLARDDDVAANAIRIFEGDVDARIAFLRRALDHERLSVQRAALDALLSLERAEVKDVVLYILQSPEHVALRRMAFPAIASFLQRLGDPSTLPAIAELLDSPDLDLRDQALQTIQHVRRAAEEREEWKKFAPPTAATRPGEDAKPRKDGVDDAGGGEEEAESDDSDDAEGEPPPPKDEDSGENAREQSEDKPDEENDP